jgi:WXG100 family type VII secretion target
MSGVNADPDELRALADRLDRAGNALAQVRESLDSRHEAVAATWRDEKYRAFEDVFSESLSQLRRLSEEMSRTAVNLRRKATPLDDYLSRGGYR